MGAYINAITSALGAGMGIYGQFQQQKQQNWENGLTMEQFNRRNEANTRGVESWNASSNPARDTSLQLRDLFTNALAGDQGSQSQLAQLLQTYPGVLDQLLGSGADPFGRGMSGGMSSIMGQNLDRRGAYTNAADTALAGFQGGGWSPGREDTQARFMDMLNGQGAQMGALGDVGGSLLSGRGQTAATQGFQDRGTDAFNRGGMNDQLQAAWAASGGLLNPQGATGTLDALQGGGLGLFGNQGFNQQNQNLYSQGLAGLSSGALGTAGLTEAGGLAELAGLGDLQNGGRTGLSDAMGARGMELAGGEALLPMEVAIQIAREDAARNSQGAFRQAQRQAQARHGGAAGVVAAGGAEHDPMSEYADAAARQVSDAGRSAMVNQQGLALTQQGQGIGMAGAAGNLENSRYGSAGNLVGNMEGNATQRYQANAGIAGQGLNNALGYAGLGSQTALSAQQQETQRFLEALGLLPQISNAASNQLGVYGNTALNAGQLENSRMNTGISGLQAYNQNRLGAGSLMNNSLTDQGNYALGLGNLGNTLENSYQNAGNNAFNQMLGAGQFGAGLNQQQFNGFNNYYNNAAGFNRDNMTGAQTNVNNLFNLGGQGLQYAQAGLTGQNYGMTPASQISNPWASLGQGLANVNFSGLFGGNSGRNTSGNTPAGVGATGP